MATQVNLTDITFKKLNTVGDVRKMLTKLSKMSNVNDSTPIVMFSDEEGNAVNKLLAFDFDGTNIIIVPWEGQEIPGYDTQGCKGRSLHC